MRGRPRHTRYNFYEMPYWWKRDVGQTDRAKVSLTWSLYSPTSLYNVRIKPSEFNTESGSGLYRMSGCIVGRGRRMNSLREWDSQWEHEWGPGDIIGEYNTLVNNCPSYTLLSVWGSCFRAPASSASSWIRLCTLWTRQVMFSLSF